MAVSYTNVRDGVSHTRTTFSRTLVTETPDWIARIGSSGGEHNYLTCAQCAMRKLLSQRSAIQRVTDAASDAQYLTDSLIEQRKLQDHEYFELDDDMRDYLASKQADRIVRMAKHCPVRRIPFVLKELRGIAALAQRQATEASSEATRSQCIGRYFVAQQAATLAWRRLKDASADSVTLYRLRQHIPPMRSFGLLAAAG